ncbi:ATP-binding protein [Acinetobacter sp.]|jgi:signal transduction histidine kinase|uniref:ATP-binding protein n=1 Tax=Acinetobacter sp. TaxID=472 RepID=UPI0035AFE09C
MKNTHQCEIPCQACCTVLPPYAATEALPSILKHSQAAHVRAALHEYKEHKHDDDLILEIQDNGIGFDPSTVESGLHVGLQSMCARIECLGRQFQVESRTGCMVIQVILPLTADVQEAPASAWH